jgi:arabinose-5-phosphate isomerase
MCNLARKPAGFFHFQGTTCLPASLNPLFNSLDKTHLALHSLMLALNQEPLLGSVRETLNLLTSTRGKLVLSGMGKSGIIARKLVSTMLSLGTVAVYLHPTDALHGDLGTLQAGDTLWLLSNSGKSSELEAVAKHAKWLGNKVILMTSNPQSPLATHADISMILPSVEEAWHKAPTASTSMQLALGDALAVALAEAKGFSEDEFQARHPGGAIGAEVSL